MLEYDFISLTLPVGGYSLLGGVGILTEGHREIIRARAADGWIYDGFLPTKQRAEGYISALDLIFHRAVPQSESDKGDM